MLSVGIKTFKEPFARYRSEFCPRTNAYRLPHGTRVKFIRNESFLNEFIGGFHSRTKHSFLYLYNINAVRLISV